MAQYIVGFEHGYYFPNLVWENGAVSTAITIPLENILPEDHSTFLPIDISTYFGTDYVKQKSRNGAQYYLYKIEGFEVLFYEIPIEGINTYEYDILIREEGTFVEMEDISGIKSTMIVINPEERKEKKWQKIEQFVQKLGQDKSSILTENVNWVKGDDFESYIDPDLNITYLFNQDGKCEDIFFPAKYLIGEENQSMSMQEIADTFSVPLSWSNYEEYLYVFEFEDITLRPISDENGIINSDSTIFLTKQHSSFSD